MRRWETIPRRLFSYLPRGLLLHCRSIRVLVTARVETSSRKATLAKSTPVGYLPHLFVNSGEVPPRTRAPHSDCHDPLLRRSVSASGKANKVFSSGSPLGRPDSFSSFSWIAGCAITGGSCVITAHDQICAFRNPSLPAFQRQLNRLGHLASVSSLQRSAGKAVTSCS